MGARSSGRPSRRLVVRLRGGDELYDLENDPAETRNLHGRKEYDAIVSELMREMLQWCLRTDTDRPFQNKVGA